MSDISDKSKSDDCDTTQPYESPTDESRDNDQSKSDDCDTTEPYESPTDQSRDNDDSQSETSNTDENENLGKPSKKKVGIFSTPPGQNFFSNFPLKMIFQPTKTG